MLESKSKSVQHVEARSNQRGGPNDLESLLILGQHANVLEPADGARSKKERDRATQGECKQQDPRAAGESESE